MQIKMLKLLFKTLALAPIITPSVLGDSFIPTLHNSHAQLREEVRYCKYDRVCAKIAEVIVYESRGEPARGRRLVGSVVLNRVKDKRFPNTIEEVVHQRRQFSYLNDMHKQKKPTNKDWQKAYFDATILLKGDVEGDILWYHSRKVKPSWSESLEVAHRVGNHIFYK